MSKVSSKLAAGVRKVKAQQAETRPAQPAPAPDTRMESAPARIPSSGRDSPLHPARVWPD